MSLETLADARWDCGACTSCCRAYLLGPVEPAVVQALEARGLNEEKPGWYRSFPGPDGPVYFLGRQDDACVFLQQDKRCELHVRFGAEAKPGFCREYPFRLRRGAAPAALTVRPSCSGLHMSFATGTPLAEVAPGLAALPLAPLRVPGARPPDAPVAILPGIGVEPSVFDKLAPALIRRVSGVRGEPSAVLADLRAAVFAAAGRASPPPDPSRAEEIARMLLDRLLQILRGAAESDQGEPWQRLFFADAADLVGAALSRRRPPPWHPDVATYLNQVLRGELLSRELLHAGGLAEGTALWWLGTWVARSASPEASLAELGPRHATWCRLTENRQVIQFFRGAAAPLAQLFLLVEPATTEATEPTANHDSDL